MRELIAKGLDIDVPNGSAFSCETPPLLPKMHFLCAVVGKRGSGKMVASLNLIEKMNVIDRMFYISPSAESNSTALARLGSILAKEDTYSDVNDVSILGEIVSKIEKERDDYEDYHKRLKEEKHKTNKFNSLFELQRNELLKKPKPRHRYNGRVPCILVYFDDILGSNMFIGKGMREVSRLCMYHRHIAPFTDAKQSGAVGCSMLFNVQSMKTSIGGLPPALRSNLTLLLLFQTASKKELSDIAESVSGEINEESFLSLCRTAWKNPHDFLMIDFHKKSSHPSSYRRNMNTFLVL